MNTNNLHWVGDYMLSELYNNIKVDISVGLFMDKNENKHYCISYLDGSVLDSWYENQSN